MYRIILDKLSNIINRLILTDFAVSEDVMNNIISAEVRYILFPTLNSKVGSLVAPIVGVIGHSIASLPDQAGYNPYPPFSQGTRTDTDVQLAANAYAKACYTDISTVGRDVTGQLIPPDTYTLPTQVSSPPYGVSVASFSVGPDPDFRRQYFEDSAGVDGTAQTGYTNYDVKRTVTQVPGSSQVPIANQAAQNQSSSGTGNTAFNTSTMIGLFQPVTRTTVEFEIGRIQAIPEAPDPNLGDSNMKLLVSKVSLQSIGLFADGDAILFRMSGLYEYGAIQPNGVDDTMKTDIAYSVPANVNRSYNGSFGAQKAADYFQGIIS